MGKLGVGITYAIVGLLFGAALQDIRNDTVLEAANVIIASYRVTKLEQVVLQKRLAEVNDEWYVATAHINQLEHDIKGLNELVKSQEALNETLLVALDIANGQ